MNNWDKIRQWNTSNPIYVNGIKAHESTDIEENSMHVKWDAECGLIVCPEDIASVRIAVVCSTQTKECFEIPILYITLKKGKEES